METVDRSDSFDDDVAFEDMLRSKTVSSLNSRQNDDRPPSSRSHHRHFGRHSIAEENRLPSPHSPNGDTTRRESLALQSSARESLITSASLMSHRRQTVGGKLGFIAFEDILSDVISLCPQMTSWLNDSLDNVVCVNCDMESSKEKALPAFYYANTSSKAAGVGSKSRPSTVSLWNGDGCCLTPRPTPTRRRSTKRTVVSDDSCKCFARSPSSLRVIYEPEI